MASNAKLQRRLSSSSDESKSKRATGGAAGSSSQGHSSNGKAAQHQQQKSSHVSFSSNPAKVFDTYSSKEYERKDIDMDPLTASIVFQLEKLAEDLDSYNVTLNKGSGGLGFSIIGMGFGDNLGPEDKLSICVKQLLEKSTAQKDGRIQPGDQIIEVNGKSMVGVTYSEAVEILKTATGKVSLRMGRGGPGGSTPDGLPHRELVQMGFQGSSTPVSHQSIHIIDDDHKPTSDVVKKATLTAGVAIHGASATIGHQSGHINNDHRSVDEVTRITHTTSHGPSTPLVHQSGHHINGDHRMTDDVTKKAAVIAHTTSHGPSTTIVHQSSHNNDDHRLVSTDVVKKAPATAHAFTRRDSSSDEEGTRKRLSSEVHGIDDQPNPNALMLKLELASIKRKELEKQLEVIRAEIDGVLRQKSSDGRNSAAHNERIKLIEVEATLRNAKQETDRMKALRDNSERQIDELDKRLRSEIRLMHETHSTSLQVIEQFRSKEREHDNEKENIKRRLCDMDQQYEKQIHTLTEKIRHLEVRFSGSYDEVDMTPHVTSQSSHVTPGIALAVNHANDRSPDKSVAVLVKTGSHSSDSDSDDGRRRKLTTTLPGSVVSVHSPAGKSM